jgi:hypothetical protein
VTLKTRAARGARRKVFRAAPAASHGRQLGRAAATNTSANATDWPSAPPAPRSRKVAVAPAQTSHDFGLTHWNAAAPAKPTGRPAGPELPTGALAIFHASQTRKAAPSHFTVASTTGWSRMTLPRPKATRNIITPMPSATPSRQGSPRRMPTWAPVVVSSALLGPGVPAATTEKTKNAAACSGVIVALHSRRLEPCPRG